jgi:hypothetical protein
MLLATLNRSPMMRTAALERELSLQLEGIRDQHDEAESLEQDTDLGETNAE